MARVHTHTHTHTHIKKKKEQSQHISCCFRDKGGGNNLTLAGIIIWGRKQQKKQVEKTLLHQNKKNNQHIRITQRRLKRTHICELVEYNKILKKFPPIPGHAYAQSKKYIGTPSQRAIEISPFRDGMHTDLFQFFSTPKTNFWMEECYQTYTRSYPLIP